MVLFGQTPKEFFKSKTNWLGLSAIVSAVVGYYAGQVDVVVAVQGVMGGLAMIAVKDAIVKTKPTP